MQPEIALLGDESAGGHLFFGARRRRRLAGCFSHDGLRAGEGQMKVMSAIESCRTVLPLGLIEYFQTAPAPLDPGEDPDPWGLNKKDATPEESGTS
jgi:hypothetical protein